MTLKSFPRDIEQRRSSPGVVAETGGGNFRLFSSSRFTTFNAVQANEVQAVSECIFVPFRHGQSDTRGFDDGQKVFA